MKKKLIFTLFSTLIITSCSMFGDKSADSEGVLKKKRMEPNIKKAQREKINEGGLVLFGNKKNPEPGESSVLWKATLQTLDFIPIANASYGGGIIITDWYMPKDNLKSSIKISVKFLSSELSVSSIDVDAFEKKCEVNNCLTKKMSTEFNQKIKLSIINKAKEIALENENKKNK